MSERLLLESLGVTTEDAQVLGVYRIVNDSEKQLNIEWADGYGFMIPPGGWAEPFEFSPVESVRVSHSLT